MSLKDDQPRCDTCGDTGFQILTCDGSPCPMTPRRHYAHTYAKPCFCRPVNEVWQERIRQQRRGKAAA